MKSVYVPLLVGRRELILENGIKAHRYTRDKGFNCTYLKTPICSKVFSEEERDIIVASPWNDDSRNAPLRSGPCASLPV